MARTAKQRAALRKAQLASARKRKGRGRGKKKASGRGAYARWVNKSVKKGGASRALAIATFSPLGYGVSKFRGRKRR